MAYRRTSAVGAVKENEYRW
eukprot:gene1233-biopygen1281